MTNKLSGSKGRKCPCVRRSQMTPYLKPRTVGALAFRGHASDGRWNHLARGGSAPSVTHKIYTSARRRAWPKLIVRPREVLMRRAIPNFISCIVLGACTIAPESNCPGHFTPDNFACAWDYCVDHPEDSRCLDAGMAMDGSTIDSGRDMDASSDADCGERCKPDGDAASQACDEPGDCTNTTLPHCGPAGKCVACLQSEHCPATDPVCSGNACSGCVAPGDCSARTGTLACDTSSGDCVECTANDDSACTSQDEVCTDGGKICVECNLSEDCDLVTKPFCDGHSCRGCMNNAECEGGTVCRTSTGECVECVPNQDNPAQESCANGNACNPVTFTCTGQPRRSIGFCGQSTLPDVGVVRCVSDSECIAGHRCVATEFPAQTPYGNYCLEQKDSGSCPNRSAAKRAATSTLGVPGSYCFPNDTFTTCEGVLDFKNVCDEDADCGATGVSDGLCVDSACSYGCDSRRDCSGSTETKNNCIGPGSAQYCNPN